MPSNVAISTQNKIRVRMYGIGRRNEEAGWAMGNYAADLTARAMSAAAPPPPFQQSKSKTRPYISTTYFQNVGLFK